MKLLNLTLKNFKGIKEFTFTPNGNNADIFGDNATGKTTIQDAFTWLLFDKDSQDWKAFEIKPINPETGEALHNLEYAVAATLLTDRAVSLRKVYQEKWTKRRGSSTPQFTGHTTKYFINDVPTSKKEYQAFINSIAPEETFRLLTDPRFFSEHLHWQKRREILLEAFGDVSDQEVIDSKKSLKSLPDILNGRTLEDHRKVVATRHATINKELDKIPVRIDEVDRSLPDISGVKKKSLKAALAMINENIQKAQAEKNRILAGGEIEELESGNTAPLEKIDSDIEFLEKAKQGAETLLNNVKAHAAGQARIKELEAEQKRLAAEFEKLESELFLIDEFVRAKVAILEQKINSQFQIARFKLFNAQVNGGIEECCEVTHDGVPYSNMNNAAKINCGLDIINTLSKVYDFSAPVFIDNAEAVTDLFPVDTQVIRLIVSEKDKSLRIVTHSPEST